jgi:hypothetical protein
MELTLDVLIVAYRPVFDGLEKLLNSLAIQEGSTPEDIDEIAIVTKIRKSLAA